MRQIGSACARRSGRRRPASTQARSRRSSAEFAAIPQAVLLAVDDAGRAVGFAEMSIRSHAEGCYSGHVAYLEGWFVVEPARQTGVGRALVQAVEAWGRAQGCTELGSDAEIDNVGSAAAHRSLGFTEVERIVCFRKAL